MSDDDVLAAQYGKLLGDQGLVQLKRVLKLLHAALADRQNLENTDANGMSQRPEEFRFEDLQLIAAFLHIRILLYMDFQKFQGLETRKGNGL
jgi:hypothetical protein